MATRNVTIIVRAVGTAQAARQIDRTGSSLERLALKTSKAGRSIRETGVLMRGIGREMTHTITAPIVGIGAAAVKMSSDFKSAMVMIQAHAGASSKEVADFTKAIRKMSGREVVQSPKELADALFHIRSVGALPAPIGNDYIGVLKASAQLAAVGHANLEDTASSLAGLIKTGMPGLTNLAQVMGEVNATVGTGNMRMQDFNDLVASGVFPVAKEAGLKFRDVAAATAVLTDENWKAARAGTLLRTSFHFLTSPSDRAANAMKKIGLKSSDMARDLMQPNGLLVALKDLRDHLERVDPVQRNVLKGMIFPTGRGTPLYVLMNQLDNYQAKIDQIGQLAPHFQESLRVTMEAPGTRMHKSWSLIQNDLITLGDILLPTVADGFEKVANWIDTVVWKWQGLSKEKKKWVGIGIAVAAAVGPLLAFLGTVGILVGGATQLAGGIAGMVGAVARVLHIPILGKLGKKGKKGLGGLGTAVGTMTVKAGVVNVYGGLGGTKPHLTGPPGKIKPKGPVSKVLAKLAPWASLGADTIIANPALAAAAIPIAAAIWDNKTKAVQPRGQTVNPVVDGHVVGGAGSNNRRSMVEPTEAFAIPYANWGGDPKVIHTQVVIDGRVVAEAVHRAATRKQSTR